MGHVIVHWQKRMTGDENNMRLFSTSVSLTGKVKPASVFHFLKTLDFQHRETINMFIHTCVKQCSIHEKK